MSESAQETTDMKSLFQWQKELSDWNPVDSQGKEIPLLLQDSQIQHTIHTVVQALTTSSSSADSKNNTLIINASLEILTKAATQPTAKTLFIASGALKPISELLRKACLSQKFGGLKLSCSNEITKQPPPPSSYDEKKDDDGTTSTTAAADASSNDTTSFQTPAMALHCLANLSDNASDAIKSDYLLPIANPLLHNVMEECLAAPTLQRYACKLLYHLSNPLLQELVAAGFVEVIWKANQAHPKDAELQKYSNACLYNLLPICPEAVLEQLARPQQLVQGLVPGMMAHPASLEVQKYALLVMTRMTTPKNHHHSPLETVGSNMSNNSSNSSPTNHASTSFLRLSSSLQTTKKQPKEETNALQASHALGLPHVIHAILAALQLHAKHAEIAQVGCDLLKHVSRLSVDFANSMLERGGLKVLVKIMQCHLDHTSIQDPVLATLRNLLSLRTATSMGMTTTTTNDAAQSIRTALQDEFGKDSSTTTLQAMVKVIGLVMSIHVPDAPIQAYGCDAFGRLAALDDYATSSTEEEEEKDPKWIRRVVYDGNALRLALQAMRVHPNHSGVQDRAIVLLLRLCSYEPAYEFMRQEKEMEEEDSDADDEYETSQDADESGDNLEVFYGDEYDDDDNSIGPVLSKSPSSQSSSSSLPQSFVYKLLVNTKVSPRKESHDRLQKLMSIVNLQEKDTKESFSGFFKNRRISMEGASERMKSLRDSLSSPTAASVNTPSSRASWTLKERTSRWWQSSSGTGNH